MKYTINDLINTEKIQSLTESFYNATGLCSGIMDPQGTVIAGSGWQDICTEFHRANVRSVLRCRDSDVALADQLRSGKPYAFFTCKNGLIDAAAPIIIEGEHVAYFVVGQFLFNAPDSDFFKQQAREFGFDEKAYLNALSKVPILEQDRIEPVLSFLTRLAELIAEMGLAHLMQKNASDRIKTSEEKYRNMMEQSADGIFIIDPHLRCCEVNTKSCEMLGYTRDELTSKNIKDIVPAEDLAARPVQWDLLRTGETVISERSARKKDGSLATFEVSGRLLSDGNILANVRDITERKQAEKDLKESKRALSTLLSNLPGMAYRCKNDRDWTMELVSEGCFPLTGYQPSDLLDSARVTYGQIIHPDDRDVVWQQVQNSLSGRQPFQITYRIITAGNKIKWVWEQGQGLYDDNGNVTALEGFISDITERLQAEQNRIQLETAVEQADEIIFIADTMGRFTYVNPAFERLTGFSRKETIGRHSQMLQGEKNAESFYEDMIEAVRRGDVWKGHIVNTKKDGSRFEVQATISPIKNTQGEITHFVCVERDVTNEMNMERQLRQAQKMEALGTLAGGIAHDFNNILAAIIGFADMTLDELHRDSQAHRNIKQILVSSKRAKELVRQILTFTRKADQEKKPVKLKLIFQEVLHMLRATLPSTINIDYRLDSGAYLLADATQMQQLLMNLCTNAAHAMRDHGGVLRVNLHDVTLKQIDRVRYPGLDPGTYIQLEVTDNGKGIKPAIVDRIFDPFFTTKEIGDGTGMGLALVHGIVENHDGAISVDSRQGEGTTFAVLLPKPEGEAKDAMLATSAPLKGTETVLFVDDENEVTHAGKMMLESLGYTVVALTDSTEALKLFRTTPSDFDIVVTDQTMPALTGYELSQEILSIRPDMPVVLCTGYSEAVSPERIKKAGICDFIMKPLNRYELSKAVRNAIDTSR